MTVRVIFVSPATGPALREARFAADEAPDSAGAPDGTGALDEAGLRAARAAAGRLPVPGHAFVSPSARCRATAAALGIDPAAAGRPGELRGCAMGRWRGRTLDEVAAEEPQAVMAWLTDPDAAPHGGESVRELSERVGRWLDGLTGLTGRVVVVAEPDVVRAAAVHALGAPLHAYWRLDVPPLTATELSGRAGRWNLRVSARLDG